MKIRKGDHVVVLSGKDKGRRGEVVRAMPKDGRVIVEGINRVKRHQRTTQIRKRAGIIEKDLPVPVSVVALVCPKEHTPTRVGYATSDDGAKRRVCARCGEAF
jgi:large subunit ribosomal protein L24